MAAIVLRAAATTFAAFLLSGSAGRQVWLARLDGGGFATVAGIASASDGRAVFVTGVTAKEHNAYATVAYASASGRQLWLARYRGAESPKGLGVSPDGKLVFVAGDVGTFPRLNAVTIAYDAATGARRWLAQYDDPVHGTDAASSLSVSPDGRTVVVTAQSGERDWIVLAYDARSGRRIWLAPFAGDTPEVEVGSDSRTVFVAGTELDAFRVTAHSLSTGAKLWSARYAPPGQEGARAVDLSVGTSAVYVTGVRFRADERTEYVTLGYRARDGARRWVAAYLGRGKAGSVVDIGASPNGSTTYLTGTDGSSLVLIAYNAATGSQLWVRRVDAHGAAGLAVGLNGNVYVTGSEQGSGNFLTSAYDARGTQRWRAGFDRGFGGGAGGITVSRDGHLVFVAGRANPMPETGGDYLTIAYRG